jgi:polyhydroxyalkanoate synthesis regulator phasin
VVQLIIGTQGRINELLAGIPAEDIVDFHVNNDKAWVIVKDDATAARGLAPQDIADLKIVQDKYEKLKEAHEACKKSCDEITHKYADMCTEGEHLTDENEALRKQLDDLQAKYQKDIDKLKKQVAKLTAV